MRWVALMVVCGASAFSSRRIPSTSLHMPSTSRQHLRSDTARIDARARQRTTLRAKESLSPDARARRRTASRAKDSDEDARPPGFGEGCLEPKDQAGLAFLAVLSGWHFFIGPVVREAVLAARAAEAAL
jgi:hypothetical protein